MITSTRRLHRLILSCAAALPASLATQGAHAQTADEPQPMRATLLDDQLTQRTVTILSLDDRLLTFTDEQPRRRTLARPAILAILPIHEQEPSAVDPDAGVLELVDRQRFPGDIQPSNESSETIIWSHEWLGRRSLPLEQVSWFLRPGAGSDAFDSRAPHPSSDTLYLTNGDQQSGFLSSASGAIVLETPDGDVTLDASRVLAARLSNPRVAPTGPRIWAADGTVAAVTRINIDAPGRVTIALTGSDTSFIEWSDLRAIALQTGRLRSLADLDPPAMTPLPPRRTVPPVVTSDALAPLNASDMLLSGPLKAEWTLPTGTRRLAFKAAVDRAAAPWGECTLIVSSENVELARRALSPGAPPAVVNLPIEGSTLAITIEPGKFGPIRDWVVLSQPLFLIDRAPIP